MELFKLFGTIAINSDGANEAIDKVTQKAEGVGGTLANLGSKASEFGNKLSSTGKKLSLGVTTPIVTLGGVAIKTAADFEAAMSEVSAISGATGEDFQKLENLAREMGKTTKFSASESAEALKYMAMAGWKTEDMLDGLEGVMNLAAASGEDLGTTSDIVTDALTAFGMSASESGHFADVLAKASSNANTNVGMMGETFKYVAPVAGALGYSAEDVSLAIGLMANASIKSSQAGTSLRSSLTRLSGTNETVMQTMVSLGLATAETAEVLDEGKIEKAQAKVANKTVDMEKAQIKYNDAVAKYGTSSSQAQTAALNLEKAENNLQSALNDLESAYQGNIEIQGYNNDLMFKSDGTSRALRDVIMDLREKFSTLSEEEQLNAAAVLFGQEAMSGMLAVINASDEDFDKLVASIDSADGAAKDMADTMNNNLSGQVTLLKSQLGELAIQFVTLVMPYLKQGVEWLSKVCDWIAGLDDNTKKMIMTVGGIAAAAGPVLILFGKVSTGIGEILKVGSLLFRGVGKLTPLISGVMGIGGKLIGGIGGLVTKIGSILLPAISSIGAPVLIVIGVITALIAIGVLLYQNWDEIREWAGRTWEKIKDIVGGAIENIKGFFSGIIDFVKDNWQGLLLFLVNPFVGAFKLLYDNCEQFRNFIDGFLEKLKSLISGAMEKIKGFFSGIIDFVKNNWQGLLLFLVNPFVGAFKLLYDNCEQFRNFIDGFFGKIKEGFQNFISGMGQKASEFKNKVVETAGELKDKVVNRFQELKEGAISRFNELKENASARFHEMTDKIVSKAQELKENAVNKFNELKEKAGEKISSLKDRAVEAFDSMREKGLAGFEKLKSGALEKFEHLKAGISEKLDAVKNFVSNAVQKLKDFFNFDWKLPKIKLPHFTIDGSFSLNPPSIPKFGIDWYKSGGIMTKPTAFGINPDSGKVMAGGEAGPEAIAPIELLKQYVKEAVEERDEGLYEVLEAILALLREWLPKCPGGPIVLDDGTLVGKMAGPMNEKLGWMSHTRGRWN